MVRVVKNMPHLVGDVASSMEEFVKDIFSIAGSTIIEEIKVIVQHIRQFVDGVKQDVLSFYNDIVDAVTMAMPYIGKKIIEAFKLIFEGMKALFKNPIQAITAMSRAVTDVKMAVTMIVDTKNKIVNACLFIKGRAKEWLNTAKKIPQFFKRISEVFKKLSKSSRSRRDLVDDMSSVMSDGLEQSKSSLHSLEDKLMAKWDKVWAPLKPVMEIAKPFLDEYKIVMTVIRNLRQSYKTIKETIGTSKKLIQKVFGPKFHRDFPTERRPKGGDCKEGVWPSNTTGYYKTTGVDLSLGVRQSIKMPVNGIVIVHPDKRVIVQPTDPEFKIFEIVIENINVFPTTKSGARIVSGKKIGRATKSPKCSQNFIHVSVRHKKDTKMDDADYDYTDPSPFLDRLVPIPKWIKDCSDYEFRYIGYTADTGESFRGADPTKHTEELTRDSTDFDFEDDKSDPFKSDDPGDDGEMTFRESLMKSLKEQAKKFVEFFKTALFGKDGPKIPNIMEIVDLSGKKVKWVLEHLKGSLSSVEFQDIQTMLCNKMTALPKGNPLTLAVPYIKNVLKINGIKGKVGDLSKMTDRLMGMAEKACPMFRGAIAKGFGHVCTVQQDCMGISCSVPLSKGVEIKHVQIGLSAKPNERKLKVTVNGKPLKELAADGLDSDIDMKWNFFGMKLFMTANVVFKNGILSVSAEAKLCFKLFSSCLPPVELFHDIQFKLLIERHRRGIVKDVVCNGISELTVPKFFTHLADYQLLSKKVTDIFDKVRKTVVDELLEDAVDKLGNVSNEFADKVDFCVDAGVSLEPISLPFFKYESFFLVGPVPLHLKFSASGVVGLKMKIGLCVLSMTTKLTLTPRIGSKVVGKAAVSIFVAEGGIEIKGYLLELKFPIVTELVFSKYPIDVGSKMDLIFTPLTVKLSAYAKVFLLFTTQTVFKGTIWKYSSPSVHKNIFDKKKRDDDRSPPEVQPPTINQRRKRAGTRGCVVEQVPNIPYYSPAFRLEMHAEDEVSDIKLFYAIGTHRGGTNVAEWTEMGGSNLLAPSILPSGIPLYWTVKARNSQGLETIQQCSLKTYDSTLPDGRVEHSYKFSSHPSKLDASLVVFEDSPLVETHFKAVGFSPGQFGSQFVSWAPLRIDHSVAREGITGYLKHFTVPREGKLVAWVLRTEHVRTAELCAQQCVEYGQNCVSFDYEYHSETCDLHDVVQGANAYIRISGTYSNYERLGSGYHAPLEYNNLSLQHGATYFVNSKVTNVLGYSAFLIGEGTMVDFTPPEPGQIKNAIKDILKADRCEAAVTQQCIDVTWQDNHRLIIDGHGSETVYNGHEPIFDELYTLTNHYVTANWKGFHDDESGIWGYTWAVGRQVCGSDVIQFEDPFAHLSSKKFWTDSAFHKGVHLEDGKYYVTVQALNGAELGGSLVTTVCHSTPFIVDTSPPIFKKVTDIIYDEDFDLIAIYYNATDSLSKIAKAEFGLGKTKYDVNLKPYSLHAPMNRSDPFVAVEDLGLEEGKPAWLRIRVTNNVDLFTAGHGDEPIIIDKSPPYAGEVLDGDRLRQDLNFQSVDDRICAQWIDFHDQESGLSRFQWGVGTKPKLDDVVKFHNMSHYDKSGCASASLLHNRTYYSTVFAYNNAINSKAANSTSDGVLVDLTPPLPGVVFDGKKGEQEQQFTSETVTKFANWQGYQDPESRIANYKVGVYVNDEHKKTFTVDKETEFNDATISMEHMDRVHFTVYGVNGAELEILADSDGFLVDHTPPLMSSIYDNKQGFDYQNDNTCLTLGWNFYDRESFIKEYRTIIYQSQYGVKQQFWPDPNIAHYNISIPSSSTNGRMDVSLRNLQMEDGVRYSLHVTALNGAFLSTAHETTGVTIDTSPPAVPEIKLGLPKEDEEVDTQNRVLHDDEHAIRLSWTGRDSESGIKNYLVAIGTEIEPELVFPFTNYGKQTSAYIQHINFRTFTESGVLYVASVKAINGADIESKVGKSKPIYVQKASVPGIVFDGRTLFNDEMYTFDRTSIAASFYGFESESCNILSYEWAIGTTEYGTDVLTYTDYGVVMLNDTHGQAQIHIELYEDTTYYVTIRAVTGCNDEFILSTSNGIILDMTPPEVKYVKQIQNDSMARIKHGTLFQASTDTIALSINVSDAQSIENTSYALGSQPFKDNKHQFTNDLKSLTQKISLHPGEAVFITTNTIDKAGNKNISTSMAVIPDNTAPQIKNLYCVDYLSYRKSILTCEWVTIVERESTIDTVIVSIKTNEGHIVLSNYFLPDGARIFTKDIYKQITTMTNATAIYVTFTVSNIVGQSNTYGREIIIDNSKPITDGLDVVTTLSLIPAETHQRCQPPKAFAELRARGITDRESNIDQHRYKVSLGYQRYGTEVLNYIDVEQRLDGTFFVDGFDLNVGTIFYATLRVYNKAGLYTDVTSDNVVVSQSPFLTIIDGPDEEDIDYQSVPNLLQGHWKYSDPCPIRQAYWSVTDLTGDILFDFQLIPSAGNAFYNDEVKLENGRKYIVTVKTIDFLNRTKIARSDGVTLRIQPPYPGQVRDGLTEDLNFQYSTTDLSANWDSFGDNSRDPTQSIHHYEVAIGNDRRYDKTRSNIHYFVNVGLNTTYTFEHLNLTNKQVKYYITVRSYSIAGGFAEAYSNGIRVGYDDAITPGSIAINPYQPNTDSIAISWTGFLSDIDILQYRVGISNHLNIISNDTLKCSYFETNSTEYNTSPLHSVGLDEYSKIGNISLEHGSEYYVTVIAEDEAGMCTAVTSSPILIDTTPPIVGDIYVNSVKGTVVSFATSDTVMHVTWNDFVDVESGLQEIKVALFECTSCNPNIDSPDCMMIAENSVNNDMRTSFYELDLYPDKSYTIRMAITNGARLTSYLTSSVILIDSTPPLPGVVKISRSWNTISNFQHFTSQINGIIAVANSIEEYVCPNQVHIFPKTPTRQWDVLSAQFSRDFEHMNTTGVYLGIGYSSDLTKIKKSGVISEKMSLKAGNYSFVYRAAPGANIISTAAFVSDDGVIPWTLSEKPLTSEFDESKFDYVSGLVSRNESEFINNSTDISLTTETPRANATLDFKTVNEKVELTVDQFGFGVHLLGYRIGNNKEWWHMLWAKSRVTNIQRWFKTSFNPSTEAHNYKLLIEESGASLDTDISITLFVDENDVVSISGYMYEADLRLAFFTWNENDYEPPIDDIFKPFYSDAALTSIRIPDDTDKDCLHGKGFYDGESGIKEVHIGLSNSKSEVGNIRPLELFKTMCFPCLKPCDDICHQPCNNTHLHGGFTQIPVHIDGLTLEASSINDKCMNASNEQACNNTVYYINAKIVNFAGKETVVYSNGIQIDVTPPVCEYIRCLDPDYSKDAPTTHLGSNTTIGAYWDCKEDISDIEQYLVEITKADGSVSVMKTTSVGLKTKAKFDLGKNAFEDNTDYVVTLVAVNTAGMNVTESCTVHVDLFPPDVTSAASQPLYTDPHEGVYEDDSSYWTSSQTNVGVEWQGGSENTEFFEWSIGTEEGESDIFPSVMVGQNASGSAAIEDGKLKLDKTHTNTSMMDLRDRTNMTEDQIAELKDASDRKKAFFFMEPGRCLHQSLNAIGFSHLKSKIKARTVCIKKVVSQWFGANLLYLPHFYEEDKIVLHQALDMFLARTIPFMIQGQGDVHVNGVVGSTTFLSKHKSGLWESKKIVSSEVVIEAHVTSGGITIGSLNDTDKTSDYGSAATTKYIPYISNPSITVNQTSRILRSRVQHVCGVSFFISPSPTAEIEKIQVNVTVPAECSKDTDYQPALVYWDKDYHEWRHTDEGCNDYLTAFVYNDEGITTYKAEVCKQRLKYSRQRRTADTSSTLLDTPRHYELVRIRRTFSNSPPVIITDTLTTKEDNFTLLQVQTVDRDNDDLLYHITQQPGNANCSIGNTSGVLNCTLEDNFYGTNDISVQVVEIGLPPLEQGVVVAKKLSLVIEDTPDITERFYIDPRGKLHRDNRPSMSHTLQVEANDTSTLFAGTIVLADMDGGEIFTHQPSFSNLGNSTFTIETVEIEEVRKVISTRYKTISAYNVYFHFSPELNGIMTLNFIAKTALNSFTPSVTLSLYVLKNPCVYGECTHPTLGMVGCDNLDRYSTFDGYFCTCKAGYDGTWCEVENNECEPDPCSSMFDCEDLVNGYQCRINPGKLSAVLISCIIAVVGAIFLLRKLYQVYHSYKMRQSRVSLIDDVPYKTEAESRAATPFPEMADKTAKPLFFKNEAFFGDDIDLSALSTLTNTAANRLPPHHTTFNNVTKTNCLPSQLKTHVDPEPTENGVIEVDGYQTEQATPNERCVSATSRRTVSTVDADLVHIDDRMTDIDV